MGNRVARRAILLVLTASLLTAGPLHAYELGNGPTLLAGTGWFDCNRRRNQSAEFRLEFRSRLLARGLRAVVATLANSDGSLFMGTGAAYEVRLARWDLTPTFVPGVYRHGHGKDLGYPLEFRSQLELGYRLRQGSRIAVAFSHLSNAGFGSRNPGQESLTVNWQWRPGRQPSE